MSSFAVPFPATALPPVPVAKKIVVTGRRTEGSGADAVKARSAATRLPLSANVRNVNDAKALSAINYDQGFFIAPRTVLGTVRVSH